MTGPMLLEGKQLDEKRFDSEFHSELRNDNRYVSLTTLERVDFEGRPCYKVRLVRKTGGEDIEFYDVATGLKAGSITTRETQMGTVTGTAVESNYKKFGNLLQPTMVKSQIGGLAAGDHDHRGGIRQRAGVGVRAAGGNQGAAEVNGSWRRASRPRAALLAVCLAAVVDRRGCPGAAGGRDVRCRVADRPRFSLRQDPERRRLERGGRRSCGRRLPRRGPSVSCARCSATCSAGLASRTSRSCRRPPTAPTDVPRDLSGTPGFDVRLVGKDLLVTEVDADGGGAAAGVRTGWKLRSIDGALDRDAARIAARFARAASAAGRSVAARALPAARSVRLARRGRRSRTASGAVGAAVRRPPARIRTAGDRRQPADDVRAGRSRSRGDARRPARRSHRLQRLDDRRRSAVPEGGRRVPPARRHRHRSAREPGWPGGDADGHLGSFHRRAQGARGDEDARQRAAVRGQPAAGQRARASACSPSPARSRSSSMR